MNDLKMITGKDGFQWCNFASNPVVYNFFIFHIYSQ